VSEPDVILSDVLVRRSGRVTLDVPRLVVDPRTFLGIVGPNGAGKTTLLDLCAGLSLPDQGAVRELGRDLASLYSWTRADLRRAVGFVPQRTEYYPDVPLTVREVVSLGRVGPRGLLRKLTPHDHQLADRWIHRLGLRNLADRCFSGLSGGEQQKVLIARAMTQEPRILLLDEPASNLDIDWKEKLVDLLAELYRRTELTVLMVSHETGLLPACVTRVVLMKTGRILAEGAPSEVLTPQNLSQSYDTPLQVVSIGGRIHALAAPSPKPPSENSP